MHKPRWRFSGKIGLIAGMVFLAATVAVAFGYKASQNQDVSQPVTETNPEKKSSLPPQDLSKVILEVENMSCSGCISTIKASLSNIRGIGDILVDVGTGKAEVYYNNKVLKDVTAIADAVTASGYPASILKILSEEEIKQKRDLTAAKSQYYIASVGGWDIARTDFMAELEIAKIKYTRLYGDGLFSTARGRTLEDNLKVQTAARLIDEGVLMQEITKSGYAVDPEIVDQAFQAFLLDHGKDLEAFKASLEEAGYDFPYFMKKFEIKVLINQYLEKRILADATNPQEKQNAFNVWFGNSKLLAEVVYYDKDLERLTQANASGGSCCPAN